MKAITPFPGIPASEGDDVGMALGCDHGRGDDGASHVGRDIGTDRKGLPELSPR
jgi:hypothetical protein